MEVLTTEQAIARRIAEHGPTRPYMLELATRIIGEAEQQGVSPEFLAGCRQLITNQDGVGALIRLLHDALYGFSWKLSTEVASELGSLEYLAAYELEEPELQTLCQNASVLFHRSNNDDDFDFYEFFYELLKAARPALNNQEPNIKKRLDSLINLCYYDGFGIPIMELLSCAVYDGKWVIPESLCPMVLEYSNRIVGYPEARDAAEFISTDNTEFDYMVAKRLLREAKATIRDTEILEYCRKLIDDEKPNVAILRLLDTRLADNSRDGWGNRQNLWLPSDNALALVKEWAQEEGEKQHRRHVKWRLTAFKRAKENDAFAQYLINAARQQGISEKLLAEIDEKRKYQATYLAIQQLLNMAMSENPAFILNDDLLKRVAEWGDESRRPFHGDQYFTDEVLAHYRDQNAIERIKARQESSKKVAAWLAEN